ncbi:MAG: GNAT family N-acetyltransferase [Paracoccaceae bacterium]
MKPPLLNEVFEVMEATWPAGSVHPTGVWIIRNGMNGGKRVSATIGTGSTGTEITQAEEAMTALGQPQLFMIRIQDAILDQALADRGYHVLDPVNLYLGQIADIADAEVPSLVGFTLWPALSIMNEMWAAGGIGNGRLAVMDRVTVPKTSVLGRANNRAAGCAFIAIHNKIAMIHAIEVAPGLRRNGVGINIMRTAAKWAQNQGALFLSLAVTDANTAANALYTKLGLSVVGHYHYRMRQK